MSIQALLDLLLTQSRVKIGSELEESRCVV
jgi:hypothetical protein